ncbi:MAG TPA: DUF1592 domain-containing protein [Polyangiaceae bacterium]
MTGHSPRWNGHDRSLRQNLQAQHHLCLTTLLAVHYTLLGRGASGAARPNRGGQWNRRSATMSAFRKTRWWVVAPVLSPALLGAFGVACSAGSDGESLATSQQQMAPPPPMRAKIGVRATTMTVKGGNPYLNVWHEFDVTIGGKRTTRAGYLFECGGGGGVYGWSGTSGSCPFSDVSAVTYNYPNEMNSCPTSCVPSIARWQANSYKFMVLDPVPASVPINIKIPVVGNSFNSNRTISFDLTLDPATGVVTPEPQNTWDQDIVDLTDSCVTVDWIPGEWTLCWQVEVESLDAPGPTFEPAPGGARLLTALQYKRTIAEILGPEAGNAAAPPSDPVIPIASLDAFERALDRVAVSQYEASALASAEAAVASPARLAQLAPCVTQGPVDPAFREYCYGEVAHRIGYLAWRLPLQNDAKARLIEIGLLGEAEAATDGDKLKAGLKYLIATILQAPSFLYSVEVGDPQGAMVRDLNAFELASRMALFLKGRYPSEDELTRAASGELATVQGIRAAANALLSSAGARDGFNDQIDELFQLKLLATKGKNATAYPVFTPSLVASMREEVQRFVHDFAFDNPRSFLGVLTDERRFVNAELAQSVYNIAAPATGWSLVDFATVTPDQKRAGIMTMPALLAINSHPVGNSIVRRGLFASEYLFCQPKVPPPPRDADTTIPSNLSGTLREFMEVTTENNPTCAGCHLSMNRLAYAFESFDAIGRHRTKEIPVNPSLDVNTAALDTVPLFGGTDFGTYTDARSWAANAVALDDLVSRCWVDQMYRNAVGAGAGPGQDPVLAPIDQAFGTSGYLIQTLLLELVSSPAFRQVGPPR